MNISWGLGWAVIERIIFPMPPRENQILENTVTYFIFFRDNFSSDITLYTIFFISITLVIGEGERTIQTAPEIEHIAL